MSVPIKLSAFAVLLAAVFGVAFLTGTQSQALLAPAPIHHVGFTALDGDEEGYALTPAEAVVDPGQEQFIPFTVTGPDGDALPAHDDDDPLGHLHLMAFRHDYTGFQHVYPEQGEGASWWALLDLTSGPWHVIMEIPIAGGQEIAVAADITVRGQYDPVPLPPPALVADAGGLTVTRTGPLSTVAGVETGVRVDDHGQPVTDLQSGHDAVGHTVIIRPADLGYLHLHSIGSGTGPELTFSGQVPEQGRFVMFVEFFRSEQWHVATFTVDVTR